MTRLFFSSAAVIVAAAGVLAGENTSDKLKSGLEKGSAATPFNVLDVTGPNKGKKLCYR